MTVTTMIVNAILTLLLPIMIAFAWYLAYLFIQRLPLQQRAALEQFAKMAVQQTEQVNGGNPQKKTLATALVVSAFKAFKLPVPPTEMIDAAIEAAVFAMNQGLK